MARKKEFKDIILSVRIGHGYTQREFANSISVSQSNICQWESGKSAPNLETIVKICLTHGVSADYLCGLQESDENAEKHFAPPYPDRRSDMLIKAFGSLSLKQQDIILSLLDEFCGGII